MLVQRRLPNQDIVKLNLGASLGHGGEARVYAVSHDETLVAKIYHQPTPTHAAKLAVMVANPPDNPTADLQHISIAWPVDVLWEVDDEKIVGFLMPRIQGMRSIIDFYNPKTRRQYCPLFSYQYLHRTARNLAAAVAALHSRGYCIGDVNESNILVSNKALVTLVDTDSFQVRDGKQVYRCQVGKPEFTPPELQDTTFAECDRTIEHDLFGLAVLIFQLLMEGTHPFSGIYLEAGEPPPYEVRIKEGHFTYSQQRRVPYAPTRIAPGWEILHPSLQELFVRTFEDGHHHPKMRPSAQTWMNALTSAENSLITCSVNSQHRYGNHLSSCPWCQRTRQLGGRDPFPAPHIIQQGKHLLPPPRRPQKPVISPPVPLAITGSVAPAMAHPPITNPYKVFPVVFGLVGFAVVGMFNMMNSLGNYTLNYQINNIKTNSNETISNSPTKSFTHYYQQGNNHYKSRDYDLAIESFNQAIERNPNDSKAYINRGNTRYNLRDYEGAIKDYNQAIQLSPQETKAYVNRGNVRYMLASYSSDPGQDYRKAISDFDRAIQLNPKETEAYLRRGIVRYELAQYSGDAKAGYLQAITDLNQALLLNPRNAEALFRRGSIRYEIAQYSGEFDREYQQAIADFNLALQINPTYAQVYAQRGILSYELSQYGNQRKQTGQVAAIQDLQKAAKLFLEQGDLDNYQKTLGNICLVIDNKCDTVFLQNPQKHLATDAESLIGIPSNNR